MSHPSSGRRFSALGWILAIALVACLSAIVRIEGARQDEGFVDRPIEGLLQSDPALLYYLVARWDQAGGPPADFREDPRLAHPQTVDAYADYTVGQEFLVQLVRPLFPDLPLHELCFLLFSWVAALTILGVGWAGREFADSWRAGFCAALLFALCPAAYRTLGWILMREDLALPLFALHLAALLRAVRTGGVLSALLAGVLAALSLVTWHAMAFVLLLEAAVLWMRTLVGGPSPLAGGRGLGAAIPLVVAAVLVPALASRATLGAPVIALSLALVAASWFPPRWRGGWRAAAGTALVALAWHLAVGRSSDFGHVRELILAKLRHGGALPVDPAALSFEARMLWQGPFASPNLSQAAWALGLVWIPVLAGSLRVLLSPAGRARSAPLWIVALLAACLSAFVAERMLPLVALVGSILTAQSLPTLRSQAAKLLAGSTGFVFLGAQLFTILGPTLERPLAWYRPLARQDELVQVLAEIERQVPEGAAVASDFLCSTAILAHTGRPIILQPKWETAEARKRVEQFWQAFYFGSSEDLRGWLLDSFDTRYLVVDRYALGRLHAARSLAGLGPREAWRPGSAAEALFGREGGALQEPPNYELLWQGERYFGLYRLRSE